MLNKLAEQDSSDWIENTKTYCLSAVPNAEVKERVWNEIFSDDFKMSLEKSKYYWAGFTQRSQEDLLKKYHVDFFKKIPRVFESKTYKVSEAMFFYLQQSWKSDPETERLLRELKDYA